MPKSGLAGAWRGWIENLACMDLWRTTAWVDSAWLDFVEYLLEWISARVTSDSCRSESKRIVGVGGI
jgi:hypothetical protein